METNIVYHGDCLAVMQEEIADDSVDMILCDLPYGVTRNKWDEVTKIQQLGLGQAVKVSLLGTLPLALLAGPVNYIAGAILALLVQIFIRWKDL